ncbi:MAG TPA: CPBP family intramembrane glutamic endopeptidase [Micromonosporaceae bacterium]|nr:CPBP family intramembrane glutamic endopeptidase [Micromonosporaceae bacterium]
MRLFFGRVLGRGVMATALVYGELRVQTGSIWPGVVLHTMCNAIATPLLVNGHLGFAGHSDVLFSPIPSSIITMLLFGVVGLLLLSQRRARKPLPANLASTRSA